MASILDATSFWAAGTLIPENHHLTTVELNINYLTAVTAGQTLRVIGKCIKSGKRLAVSEARAIKMAHNQQVAAATATLLVM